MPASDMRGKHVKQKIPQESLDHVKGHIASFPVNESHYTRAHSEHRKYLSPSLSLEQIYRMYVSKCQQSGIHPVKSWASACVQYQV